VSDVCALVGLRSVGSFTTSFGRAFGRSPTAYRAAQARSGRPAVSIPTCVLQAYARPSSAFEEAAEAPLGRVAVDPIDRGGTRMLTGLTHAQVWVHDQDEALAFYTEKLGLELREDVTVPEMGNFRWVSVGVAGQDAAIVLMAIPGPPVFDEATREQILALVAKGAATGLFFSTDDVRSTFEAFRARGVEFTDEPTEQLYGLDAGFRDPSGNHMRMMESRTATDG
jgi:catechol 2,3-dioxygenase-like lactoylglutathione lyase family enzyme